MGRKNFNFYAVIDDNGIISIRHPEYNSLKAVFREKKDADKVVSNNPKAALKVVLVKILS